MSNNNKVAKSLVGPIIVGTLIIAGIALLGRFMSERKT